MARVLCVANQKGGVGKTTTSCNLAVGLARAGFHTLLIDFDPQCTATAGLGHRPTARHPLVQGIAFCEALRSTAIGGLDLLPGSRSGADMAVLSRAGGDGAVLQRHLSGGVAAYDFVLIDCPSSLGSMTEAALGASTEVLMPIRCEYFAMEGLTPMIQLIRKVMQAQSNRLEFGGIVLTMYDPLLEWTREVDGEVRDFFGDVVFDTVVPRDVALAEAAGRGQSVLEYAPRSRGARAYIELCMEVLERD